MNKNYIKYDKKTKQIIGYISCIEEHSQMHNNNDEGIIEDIQNNISAYTHKINDEENGFIELSDEEKIDILFSERLLITPALDISISDMELNIQIEEYYLGKIDAITWRKQNYAYLRRLAYPDYKGVYLDAMVKMSGTDPEIQTEGSLQLQQYYADCLAVKERFPKPTED